MDPTQPVLESQQQQVQAPPVQTQPVSVPAESMHPTKPSSSLTTLDNLEYALMFISMYVLGSTIGMFLHYYVDKFFPPINGDDESFSLISLLTYFSDGSSGGGVLPMLVASMIVTFPLFAFFFIHTTKKAMENPELRHLRLRKGLIYNTLVFTFLFLLWKMITLVYGALTGNFTFNFVLHFLVTVGINGLIFAYFLYEIRKEKRA